MTTGQLLVKKASLTKLGWRHVTFYSPVLTSFCFVTSDLDCRGRFDMSLQVDSLFNSTLGVQGPSYGLLGDVSAQ